MGRGNGSEKNDEEQRFEKASWMQLYRSREIK